MSRPQRILTCPACVLVSACVLLLAACASRSEDAVCAAGGVCTCSDGTSGSQVCHADGSFEACLCEPAAVDACPIYSQEYCDGRDNDCNGRVDDGEVCPDLAVANTVPFTGGVYLRGTLREGVCGSDVLYRFWPTQAATYFAGFDCYADWYRFRRSDHAIYYYAVFQGIRQDNGTDDPIVPTPPCGRDVFAYFDFDRANTLHYQCYDTVYKADGQVVARQVSSLLAVLDDGRLVVIGNAGDSAELAVLDANGRELSRPSLTDLVGKMTPLREATTVSGNRAYVAYLRRLPFRKTEIVVFTVDEQSTWHRVRRVEVPELGLAQLVLSDGTVLVRGHDPENPNGATERVVAYLPDGTTRIAWREVDSTIRAHIGHQLLVGPQ